MQHSWPIWSAANGRARGEELWVLASNLSEIRALLLMNCVRLRPVRIQEPLACCRVRSVICVCVRSLRILTAWSFRTALLTVGTVHETWWHFIPSWAHFPDNNFPVLPGHRTGCLVHPVEHKDLIRSSVVSARLWQRGFPLPRGWAGALRVLSSDQSLGLSCSLCSKAPYQTNVWFVPFLCSLPTSY